MVHFLNNSDTKICQRKEECNNDTLQTIFQHQCQKRDNSTQHKLKIAHADPILSLFKVNMTAVERPIHMGRTQQKMFLSVFYGPHNGGLEVSTVCVCVAQNKSTLKKRQKQNKNTWLNNQKKKKMNIFTISCNKLIFSPHFFPRNSRLNNK